MLVTCRSNRIARKGLAPLELVLWIPILLMVAALMVIFGTSAAWRIRGEVSARDAAWRVLTPRTASNEHRLDNDVWPHADTTYSFNENPEQLSTFETRIPFDDLVRSPLPVDMRNLQWQVTDILDPSVEGMLVGNSSIRRPFPMLRRMGSYESGMISHPVLDRTWTIGWSYRRGVLDWPNEVGGYRPSGFESGKVPNVFRRSVLLYKFPQVGQGKSAFAGAVTQAVSLSQSAGMRVLDRDEEIRHDTGGYRDFYPRARVFCTLDDQEMRERALERHVIDYLDNRNEVQLGGITRLPRTLTNYFIGMYERRIREIERLIELEGDPDGSLAREKSQLEGKLDQLEPYEDRLDEIEDDLRSTSTAR